MELGSVGDVLTLSGSLTQDEHHLFQVDAAPGQLIEVESESGLAWFRLLDPGGGAYTNLAKPWVPDRTNPPAMADDGSNSEGYYDGAGMVIKERTARIEVLQDTDTPDVFVDVPDGYDVVEICVFADEPTDYVITASARS